MKVRIIGVDQMVQGGGVDQGHLPADQPLFKKEQGAVLRSLSASPSLLPIHKFTTVSSPPPAQDTSPLGSLETGKRKVGQVQGS